jgi:hypothetical protein
VIVAVVAIVMAAIGAYKSNLSEFKGITTHESEFIIGDPDIFKDTYNIPCTNKTYGDLNRTYSGDTYLGFRCPETTNPCSINFCGADGQCIEQAADGNECYENGQCNNGQDEYCDWSTCSCEPLVINTMCMNDTQCGIVDWTTCLAQFCQNGTCIQNYTMGSECAADDDCDPGESCQDCLCVASEQCLVDADCPVLLDTCSEFTCVGGQCIEDLSAGAACSTDEQCIRDNGNGYACNITSCSCYQQPIISCLVDADCQSTDWTTCLEAICDAGQCREVLTGGSTCATTENCGIGEFCRGCACVAEIGNFTSYVPSFTFFLDNEIQGFSGGLTATYQVTGNYVSVWMLTNSIPDGGLPEVGYGFRMTVPVGTIGTLIGGIGTFTNPIYYGPFAPTVATANSITWFGYLTYRPSTTLTSVAINIYFVYELP